MDPRDKPEDDGWEGGVVELGYEDCDFGVWGGGEECGGVVEGEK